MIIFEWLVFYPKANTANEGSSPNSHPLERPRMLIVGEVDRV